VSKAEALRMLDRAPQTNAPSRINPCLTTAQVVEIIRKMVLSPRTPDPLDWLLTCTLGLYEKHVWQAYKNQKRPNYLRRREK